MRTSDLNKRRAELVEKLITAVIECRQDAEAHELPWRVECGALRGKFTALLASRWQT